MALDLVIAAPQQKRNNIVRAAFSYYRTPDDLSAANNRKGMCEFMSLR